MIQEDYLILYLMINAVLTLFNFIMIWRLIFIHDANCTLDETEESQ